MVPGTTKAEGVLLGRGLYVVGGAVMREREMPYLQENTKEMAILQGEARPPQKGAAEQEGVVLINWKEKLNGKRC